jgi:hypothetical protein
VLLVLCQKLLVCCFPKLLFLKLLISEKKSPSGVIVYFFMVESVRLMDVIDIHDLQINNKTFCHEIPCDKNRLKVTY